MPLARGAGGFGAGSRGRQTADFDSNYLVFLAHSGDAALISGDRDLLELAKAIPVFTAVGLHTRGSPPRHWVLRHRSSEIRDNDGDTWEWGMRDGGLQVD